MAIKINNTTVIDDSRQLANVTLSVVGSASIPASWASSGSLSEAKTGLVGLGDSQNAALAVGGRLNTTTTTGVTTTEEYNGTSWSLSGSLSANKFGGGGAGVQDAALTFAGYNSGAVTNTTEAYDGTSWSSASSLTTSRSFPGSFGTKTDAIAVGGNNGGTYYGSSEYFATDTWIAGTPLPSSFLRTAMAGVGTIFAGLVIGGSAHTGVRQSATWEYGDGTWTAGGNLNLGRAYAAAAGTQTDAIAMGGWDTLGNAGITSVEVYDGTTWTTGTSLSAPVYRGAGAGTQAAALSFGGDNGAGTIYNTTYEYIGATPAVVPTTSGTKGEVRYNNYLGRFEGYDTSWNKVTATPFDICNTSSIVSCISGYCGTGTGNFIAGFNAGLCATTGNNNVLLGCSAGLNIGTGGNNTIIGGAQGSAGLCDTVIISAGACERIKANASGLFVNGSAFGSGPFSVCNSTNIVSCLGGNGATGTNNFFAGVCAGICNSTGLHNIAVGACAGFNNVNGSEGIMLGHYSGYCNTSGSCNVFLGYKAGYRNISGTQNVSIGNCAGCGNVSGSHNVSIGTLAGYSSTGGGGCYNTLLNYQAGGAITIGTNNIFIGKCSGRYTTTGTDNTFLGQCAGVTNISGAHNFMAGFCAGYCNTTGCFNVFIGQCSGQKNATGYANVFLGQKTGCSNTTGFNNVFIGRYSGQYNTTGFNNIFLGDSSGRLNQTGAKNIAMGPSALWCNTTGVSNIVMGFCAGYCTTGNYNIFMGEQSGFKNTSGIGNIFLGFCSGRYNTTGCHNVFLGHQAGNNIGTSCFSIGIGYKAGLQLSSSINNIAIGCYAGFATSQAVRGIMIGGSAGYGNTYGANNIMIGNCSGYCVGSVFLGNQDNNITIGNCAGYFLSGANNIVIGTNMMAASTTTCSNTILMGTGGVERLKVDSSGLYVNGSGVGYSGSATTSGAVAANKALILNADGTVSQVSGAYTYAAGLFSNTISLSTTASGLSPQGPYDSDSVIGGNYTFLLVRDNNNTSNIRIRAYTNNSNGTLTFAGTVTTSTVTSSSGPKRQATIVWDPINNCLVLLQLSNGPTNGLYYSIYTFNGSTFTAVTTNGGGANSPLMDDNQAFCNANYKAISAHWDPVRNRITVVGIKNDLYPYVATYTCNGTALTLSDYLAAKAGSATGSLSNYSNNNLAYDPGTGCYVVTAGYSNYVLAVLVVNQSTGALSWGTAVTVSGGPEAIAIGNGKVLSMYQSSGNVYVRSYTYNSSSGALSYVGTNSYTTGAGMLQSVFMLYSTKLGNKFIIPYDYYTSTHNSTYLTTSDGVTFTALGSVNTGGSFTPNYKVMKESAYGYAGVTPAFSASDEYYYSVLTSTGVSTNLTSNNFIGISASAAATGTSINYWSYGNAANTYANLTRNTTYYVDPFGSFVTNQTANTGTVYIGRSIGTANTILLDTQGDRTITGNLTVQSTAKALGVKTGATGTVNHDYSTGDVWYHSGIADSFTLNLTNVATTNNRMLIVRTILAQGATPYIPNAISVDGSATTLYWQGGTPPTGNANKIDIVDFNLIKSTANSSWIVTGELRTYG